MNILITGTNRGLGLEFVRQYGEEGHRIFACARHISEPLEELAQRHPTISLHTLDVTDGDQIKALAHSLQDEPLDLLINNAGIAVDRQHPSLSEVDYEAWERTMEVNLFAPLRMVNTFLPALRRGERRLIVTLSSIMGSVAKNTTGGYYLYRSSKAALNAVMKSLSVDLKKEKMTVVVLHPGWVKTDMGGQEADIEPPESIAGMREVISKVTPAESGRFVDYRGETIPW